ncbi:MAG: hypothetical protein QOK42_502 [Frankiaceae bacterium]|nr:hypothetical protein [Frankiaceae bacterium]MDX6223782.1 hypothetical protein [Frankiales bacterium]MDX6274387.1 hypothetical protein [Frankiales bacterium]
MSVTVCVFCASSTAIPPHYVELAAELGTAIGERGWTLVTGGGSVSSMGAVAAAARAAGGRTIGVIPRAIMDLEVADHDSDELVVTDDMRTRKGEMDRRSDAFITLPGGIGTLEELLEVWTARTLGMHDKPVVVVDPDDAFAPLRAQADQLVERGFMRPSVLESLTWTTDASTAIAAIELALAHLLPPTERPTPEEVLEAEPGGEG